MQYVLLQTQEGNFFYQEIERGFVVRYCDMDGNTISEPSSNNWVITVSPPQPSWAKPDSELPTAPASRIISKHQFRSLFTMEEKVAIYTAAKTQVEIQIWLDDLSSADEVDLNDDYTQSGLDSLVQLQLITEQRKTEILNA